MGWVDSQTNDIFDDFGDGDDNTMLFSENILVPSALYQKFFSSELFIVLTVLLDTAISGNCYLSLYTSPVHCKVVPDPQSFST